MIMFKKQIVKRKKVRKRMRDVIVGKCKEIKIKFQKLCRVSNVMITVSLIKEKRK